MRNRLPANPAGRHLDALTSKSTSCPCREPRRRYHMPRRLYWKSGLIRAWMKKDRQVAYRSCHHQGIVTAKRLDHGQTHKTPETHGDKWQGQKHGGHDDNSMTAARHGFFCTPAACTDIPLRLKIIIAVLYKVDFEGPSLHVENRRIGSVNSSNSDLDNNVSVVEDGRFRTVDHWTRHLCSGFGYKIGCHSPVSQAKTIKI